MLNKCFVCGRLTSTPELKKTNNGKVYTKICIAINRYNEGTDFINVIVWNKQAENIVKYLDKGSLVLIEGNINVRNYEDNDGIKRTYTEVIAQTTVFLDKKNTKNNDDINDESNTDSIEEDEDPFANFALEIEEDELPFD